MATADLFCLYLESIAAQEEGVSQSNSASWKQYLTSMYSNSPAIRRHLEKHRDWYTPEFFDQFAELSTRKE